MPSWVAAGDPVYDIWMTHTPDGSVIDGLAGAPPHLLEKYSYAGDAIQMYVHCGTHLDTLNHFGHFGTSGTAGTRSSTSAAATGSWAARSTTRRSSRARSCSTSPGCTGSTAWSRATRSRPSSCSAPRRSRACRSGTRPRAGQHRAHDRVAGRARLHHRPARHRARRGSLAAGGGRRDGHRLGLPEPRGRAEPRPGEVPAGALLHVRDGRRLDHRGPRPREVCAEKQYEFAFLGFPLKLRGATGSPLRPIAVPLAS